MKTLLVKLLTGGVITTGIGYLIYLTVLNLYLSDRSEQQRAREDLPNIVTTLMKYKDKCSVKTSEIKTLKRIPDKKIKEGRMLYENAGLDQSECITYLKTSIDNGFTEKNAKEGNAKLDTAKKSAEIFINWALKVERPDTYGAENLPGLSDLLNLVKWFHEIDEEQKKQLKDDLEKCRFLAWEEIQPYSTGHVEKK